MRENVEVSETKFVRVVLSYLTLCFNDKMSMVMV